MVLGKWNLIELYEYSLPAPETRESKAVEMRPKTLSKLYDLSLRNGKIQLGTRQFFSFSTT